MIEILGSSVAALVATERLMAAGVEVRRTPTGKRSPFEFHRLLDGRDVEVGMKLLELSYEPSDDQRATPLDWYKPDAASHRPWIGQINRYVRGLIDLGPEVERRAVRERGSAVDPFLSGDPTRIADLLDADEIEEAAWQIEQVTGRTFWQRVEPLSAALEVSCGPTIWRELLWPLYNKIAGWTDIPAAQHRKVWLPSWRSQSLLDALRGEPSYRPVRPMCFGVGTLYDTLERLTRPALSDWTKVWSEPPDLFDLNQWGPQIASPPSVPIQMIWIEDDHADGVEWLIDADVPVYRRTWRNGLCCVELAAGSNADRWAYDCGFTVLDKKDIRVPIGDIQCSDERAIGCGNLNDQLLSGLAAADRIIRTGLG